jgi:putative MATE family efflux protein
MNTAPRERCLRGLHTWGHDPTPVASVRVRLRSRHDREILSLVVPAFGALAAGPLYVLVDTAIVGHLGREQLAALALAGTIVATITQLSDFLSYGTTAQVARLHGAGEERQAGGMAAQALWLSLGTGVLIGLLLAGLSHPISQALNGNDARVGHLTARYVALSAIGLPGMLVALAGEGFLRGVSDLRAPLRILVACNLGNVVLEVVFVYGFGWGLDGSALGTVAAQLVMGLLFARHMLAAPADDRRPSLARIRPLLRMGAHLTVRSAALLGAFLLASALAARIGTASLAAHQIAFELFLFLALVLDAIAIAGQIIVARLLGAGEGAEARDAASRMIGWALVAGVIFGLVLLAGTNLIPHAFTGDHAVWRRAAAAWPLFALMQPVAAVVFALDGILIGAGDTRYLALAMVLSFAIFVPVALAAGTLPGLWVALDVLMVVRLATLSVRFARGRWIVLGRAEPASP